MGILVSHYRATGDHAQPRRRKPPELSDRLFCKPVAEILLRWISAEIFEWEHGEHRATLRRQWRSRARFVTPCAEPCGHDEDHGKRGGRGGGDARCPWPHAAVARRRFE